MNHVLKPSAIALRAAIPKGTIFRGPEPPPPLPAGARWTPNGRTPLLKQSWCKINLQGFGAIIHLVWWNHILNKLREVNDDIRSVTIVKVLQSSINHQVKMFRATVVLVAVACASAFVPSSTRSVRSRYSKYKMIVIRLFYETRSADITLSNLCTSA